MAACTINRAGLSGRELSLFAAAFISLRDEDTNIQWDKFTQIAGYGSINSAKISFRNAAKKLKAFVESDGSGDVADGSQDGLAKTARTPPKARNTASTKPATRARGRPRKRKHVEAGGDAEPGPVNKCETAPDMVKQEEEPESNRSEYVSRDNHVQWSALLSQAVGETGPTDSGVSDNKSVTPVPILAPAATLAITPVNHCAANTLQPGTPGTDHMGRDCGDECYLQQVLASATVTTASMDKNDFDPFQGPLDSYAGNDNTGFEGKH